MASIAYMKSGKLVSLIQAADPSGNFEVRVLPNGQLALGADPLAPTAVLDFSEEKVVRLKSANLPDISTPSLEAGRYQVDLCGKTIGAKSLKSVLQQTLIALESLSPGTLEKLSEIRPRKKRIVARNPNDLFAEPGLISFADRLNDGWWFGTNNSAQETKSWLERAVTCAGLVWGRDCRTTIG
jgi:hypothetical protein